jgi:probable FeS assembly SUF system protein SufT
VATLLSRFFGKTKPKPEDTNLPTKVSPPAMSPSDPAEDSSQPRPPAPVRENDLIQITRDCEVVEIPGGGVHRLVKGTSVSITQALGGSHTLSVPSLGGLFRLAGRDADAISKEVAEESPAAETSAEAISTEDLEAEIWAQLKTCFDPEIPVNIVDLGLIYDMAVSAVPNRGNRVDVKMTLTAQGCGMGDSIAADARHKLQSIAGVDAADVQIVWDPPWTPDKISDEGKALMGIG